MVVSKLMTAVMDACPNTILRTWYATEFPKCDCQNKSGLENNFEDFTLLLQIFFSSIVKENLYKAETMHIQTITIFIDKILKFLKLAEEKVS